MIRIEGEIVINRPVEDVFDFVADERNEPRNNPQMRRAEQISDGPIGVGTRFRAELVNMGRTVEMVIEFTGFERPRRPSEGVLVRRSSNRVKPDERPVRTWLSGGAQPGYVALFKIDLEGLREAPVP